MDDSLEIIMTVEGINDKFTYYDEETRNVSIDTSLIKRRDVGKDYVISILLDD